MDTGKIIKWGLIALFLITLGAAGYFSYRLYLAPKLSSIQEGTLPNLPKSYKNNGPISKMALADNEGIIYQIDGAFTDNLEMNKSGNLLKGQFSVKDDPSKQKIIVYLGMTDNQILLGKYIKSFSGESKWTMVSTKTLLDLIKPGREVRLRITYLTIEGSEDIQNSLDNLYTAISSGRTYFLADNFALAAGAVGIIE